MRTLRAGAWAAFCLDLVVLAQLVYRMLPPYAGDPETLVATRGLALLLGSGLLGTLVALIVASRTRSRAGLWLSLILAAIPLLWVAVAILQSLWE